MDRLQRLSAFSMNFSPLDRAIVLAVLSYRVAQTVIATKTGEDERTTQETTQEILVTLGYLNEEDEAQSIASEDVEKYLDMASMLSVSDMHAVIDRFNKIIVNEGYRW